MINNETLIVNVLVNNDRQKKHPKNSSTNPNIYLNNNQEFQLEFISHYSDIIAVSISINGNKFDRKLVINPGERIVLDRYLDKNKKFLFEEYDLELKNDPDTYISKQIYENSEMDQVEIGVYKQVTPINITYYKINEPYITPYYNENSTYTVPTGSQPIFSNNNTLNTNFDIYNTTSLDTERGGKIGYGSTSNQEVSDSNINFGTEVFETIKFRLNSLSTKPITKKDLVRYCTTCGKKGRKNDKFCGNCGTKL